MEGYSAKAVANHFLRCYGRAGIGPLKLQKLLYVAHGWHLALRHTPLIGDEYVEAWQYGPGYPSVYCEFREFGAQWPITRLATDLDDNSTVFTPDVPRQDTRASDFLKRIWEVYGDWTAHELAELGHSPDTPWHEARNRPGWRRNEHIDDEAIKLHFLAKMERHAAPRNGDRASAEPAL